jgi:hypothetical protein
MRPSARIFARGLAAIAAVGLVACFDFDATTAGGPLSDASTVGADANLGDASPGGPVDSSEETLDAGGEAGVAPPPDGGPYCASLPAASGVIFCDDFDLDPLPGGWSTRREIGGSLAETSASAVSMPNSLDEKINVLALYDPVDVSLRKQPIGIPSFPAKLLFGFSIEPVQIDTSASGAIVLSAIDFLDDAMPTQNRYSLDLSINVQNGAPALILSEQTGFTDGGGPYVPHPLPPTQPLPLNAWTNLVVEVDWTAATNAQASVTVNGTQVLAPVALTMTVQATHLQIGIGTSYVNEPSPGWELRYDDVSFAMK